MRMVSVIAQDPSVKDSKGRILMAKIRIPQEIVAPGPIGHRVQLVDYDSTEGRFHGAHALPATFEVEPPAWMEGRPSIVSDYRFHAQNVYALVMKTLARFEHALGRRVSWSFRTHQLKVAPHGMLDANAFYAPAEEGLVFGYFPGLSGKTVYTCLSHDVVVHETTHALLDALRERFLDPSSPDQAAFHEGFADVIALLSVFTQQELVEELLRRGRANTKGVREDTIHASDVSAEALRKSALFGLADQMGEEMEGVRGSALRQSTALPADPALRYSTEFLEPHRRGELLVAAALQAFIAAWTKCIAGLGVRGQQTYSLARVAEAGAHIADLLVTMWIRAVDYMPPVHLEFGDALSAALTADLEARPDDSRYRLRFHTKEAFKAYGFEPAEGTTASEGIWGRAPAGLTYENVRFESMRTDKDEVFRFLWENRKELDLRPGAYTQVLSVRPCTRVGEDGFTLRETVAEYYQVARLTPEELRGVGIEPPKGWVAELQSARSATRGRRAKALGKSEDAAPADDDDGDELVTPLYGGGTLIFDEYGRLKYHIHNDVFGKRRQSKRLEYLYQAGLLRAGRTGARLSAARLSAVHRLRATDARRFPQEGW
jgi:hypothetical protein